MNRSKAASLLGSIFLASVIAIPATSALAWDGTDSDGSSVEIDQGNRVRTGDSIDYHNYDDGEDHSATVDSVTRAGSSVEVAVTDDDSSESTTLDMDDQ